MSDTPLGRFAWYELLTSDADAAPGFYAPITGWVPTPMDMPDAPYTLWMNGEAPVGGVMALPEEAAAGGAPPHWLVHISTPDLDATVAKAKELGANILASIDVPDIGRFAVVADPQGAVFSAYQPQGDTPGHDGPPAVGEFSWNELLTTDFEAAFTFYSELFGWQLDHDMDMGPMGTYRVYNRGAHPLGGIMNQPENVPYPSWMFYIRVADVAAAIEAVKAGGGAVINEPMDVPGGDIVAHCSDPQGAVFALHSTAGGSMA